MGRMVLPCACGETQGTAKPRRLKFHPSSSLLVCNEEIGRRLGHDMSPSSEEQKDIFVTPLDFLCVQFGIEHIDLLKIDVQGYEARVLRGAQRILRHTDRVIIEILMAPHYEGQSDPDEIRKLLNEAGLYITRELSCDRFPDNGEILEIDALFERI